MKKNCFICGEEFEAPEDYSKIFRLCPKCSKTEARRMEEEQKERDRIFEEERWSAFCPPEYRHTQIEKLPDPKKADEVLAWEYGKIGLILHGQTGRGKTRCAWLLIEKLFKKRYQIRIMNTGAGLEYGAMFSDSPRRAMNWIESRERVEVLVLDDVFKVRLTDSFEAALFSIVDYRLSHQLPIIATLNDTGETLSARMSPDRADPFLRRLREMCKTIQF